MPNDENAPNDDESNDNFFSGYFGGFGFRNRFDVVTGVVAAGWPPPINQQFDERAACLAAGATVFGQVNDVGPRRGFGPVAGEHRPPLD